jgi:hypothetical protein
MSHSHIPLIDVSQGKHQSSYIHGNPKEYKIMMQNNNYPVRSILGSNRRLSATGFAGAGAGGAGGKRSLGTCTLSTS